MLLSHERTFSGIIPEAWRFPFDFLRPDGSRDQGKHNELLNSLIDVMLRNIEGFFGYAATTIITDRQNAHREYYEDCVIGSVSEAVMSIWNTYQKPVHLVFDQQTHYKGC